jgi:hypothetical protein
MASRGRPAVNSAHVRVRWSRDYRWYPADRTALSLRTVGSRTAGCGSSETGDLSPAAPGGDR